MRGAHLPLRGARRPDRGPPLSDRPSAGLLGAVEGGGTRFVVAVRDAATDETLLHEQVPTTDAATTLGRVRELLGIHGPLAAVGVACFGPLDTRAGRLFDTPKPTWAGADLRQGILPRPDVPVRFETDVVGAALGEQARGAGQGCRDLVYVTIGTGIGAGLVVDGAPVRGRLHPEVGHLRLARGGGTPSRGVCPHHGSCWRDWRAARPSLRAPGAPPTSSPTTIRSGNPSSTTWPRGLLALTLTTAPERLLVGGGGRAPSGSPGAGTAAPARSWRPATCLPSASGTTRLAPARGAGLGSRDRGRARARARSMLS